ncbi:MAG: hypothetical protein AB1763_09260 [Campylobacterota bacterium]
MADSRKRIERSLTLVEFVATSLANYRRGDLLCTDGMYTVLEEVITEINEAMDGLVEKPVFTPLNKTA